MHGFLWMLPAPKWELHSLVSLNATGHWTSGYTSRVFMRHRACPTCLPQHRQFPFSLQEEAATRIPPQAWASDQHAGLRCMYARFRHMGYQCGALALKYADDNDDRQQLLVIMGDRWGLWRASVWGAWLFECPGPPCGSTAG